jgi:hypothetical protein
VTLRHALGRTRASELAKAEQWLTARLSSCSQASRALKITTGNVHPWLSSREAACFYLLVWSDSVLSIIEQCPLLRRAAIEKIAAKLGIAHPANRPDSPDSIVINTDIRVTVTGSWSPPEGGRDA